LKSYSVAHCKFLLIVGILFVGLALPLVFHSGQRFRSECAVCLHDVGPRQMPAPCSWLW